MIIKSVDYEKHKSVVNVSIPVASVVTSLPRTFRDAEVIRIHLKRKLEYRHSFLVDTIVRPEFLMKLSI